MIAGSMVAVMTRTCPRASCWRPVLLLAGNKTDVAAGVRSTPGAFTLRRSEVRDVLVNRHFTETHGFLGEPLPRPPLALPQGPHAMSERSGVVVGTR
jgi:hypothetical protein